jgi:hypothetical protein
MILTPKKTNKKKSKIPVDETISPSKFREGISKTKASYLGEKMIRSRDVYDSNFPIFTTQRKRVLNFAVENEIPSKFVIPIFDRPNGHSPSDLSSDLMSIDDFIRENMNQVSYYDLVQMIRKHQNKILETEALYQIYKVLKEDNLLTDEFFMEASKVSSTYADEESFENEYKDFEENMVPYLLKIDQRDFEMLDNYFNNLEDQPPVLTSDMTITKKTIEFDVQLKESNETLLNIAPDLFARIQTTYEIPFVKYNDAGSSKYKTFAGNTFETRPPFKLFENRFSKFEDKNMIYMILLGDPENNIQEYTKKSYISASLHLTKNILSFKYFVLENRSEEEIIKSIENTFPEFILKNRREKNYGAEFNVYDTNIGEDFHAFLDILIREQFIEELPVKFFSSVLFVDESEKPVSEKKKLKIYYDTNIGFEERQKSEELSRIASLGFYMTQYESGVNDTQKSKGRYTISSFDPDTDPKKMILGLKDTITKSLFLDLKTPYITVTISKAVNRFVLFQFMNVFSRLINIYNELKENIDEDYKKLIPNIDADDLGLIIRPKKSVDKDRFGKINLSTISPEIFTKSYSRDCQYKNQPIVIQESEIEEWQKKTIKYGTKNVPRPVEKLGDYIFVCPTEAFPFVEFKKNKDPNRTFDIYPCCYKSEQKEIRQRESGTSYRSKDPIKTNKLMAEGGLATLPTLIEEMLKGGMEKPTSFYRIGTHISPSSLLSCVCLAIEDKAYLKIKKQEEKESYLQSLRLEIAKRGNFLTTSSELFDVSEKDRIENFKKLDEFLDPALYYRVLEEIFGLNIFVFTGSLHKPNVDPVYNLEVNRFSGIPTHSYRSGYPTLLIYKHWGAETDHLDYPQCEIIVSENDNRATLFSSDMAKYLLKGYFIASEVYGKLYLPEQRVFQNYSSLTIYEILQSNFLQVFSNPNSPIKAIGQIIDDKGKLCALQLETPKGKMTLGVPPLPPQNLPLITEIQEPKISDVVKVFRDPASGYSYEMDHVISVWFPLLNMPFGIQVPIKSMPIESIRKEYRGLLPSVPENRFIMKQEQSEIQRLMKLQKDVNMIIQLVRWLFLISLQEVDRTLTLDEKMEASQLFIETYIREEPRRDKDSSNIYDFSRLPRKLPSKDLNLDQCLEKLSEVVPTFTNGREILISGKVFYKRVKESLEHFVRLNLNMPIPEYLDGFYESVYDYPKIPKTLLFLSDIDFKRWLKQAKEDPTSSYPVIYALKPKLLEMSNPYLYAVEMTKPSQKNPFGQNLTMMIQNAPALKSKESALENALRWQKLKVNRKEISKRDLSEFTNYKVFTISSSENFELIEDESDPVYKKDTLFILQYPGTESYASILPL